MGKLSWAMMLQLGNKMWSKFEKDDFLTFDREVWDKVVSACAGAGVDTILLDLGEGMRFDTHPELAVKGSWTKNQMADEIARLRNMGITLIPKLNFSATHDHWLGPWRYQLSTPAYYKLCGELIDEVWELFGTDWMHVGLDEESPYYQAGEPLVRCRQGELWWHDAYYYIDLCEKRGMRAAVWPSWCHDHPEEYVEKMPKSVIQTPYYYGDWWDDRPADIEKLKTLRPDQVELVTHRFRAYRTLAENGYDILSSGSNWSCDCNFSQLVDYCTRHTGENLRGFLQTPWIPTAKETGETVLRAVELLRDAKNGLLFEKAVSEITDGTRFE